MQTLDASDIPNTSSMLNKKRGSSKKEGLRGDEPLSHVWLRTGQEHRNRHRCCGSRPQPGLAGTGRSGTRAGTRSQEGCPLTTTTDARRMGTRVSGTRRPRCGLCQTSHPPGCLLYTSDAADDLLCVDLGGRRIIKKKKKKKHHSSSSI